VDGGREVVSYTLMWPTSSPAADMAALQAAEGVPTKPLQAVSAACAVSREISPWPFHCQMLSPFVRGSPPKAHRPTSLPRQPLPTMSPSTATGGGGAGTRCAEAAARAAPSEVAAAPRTHC